MASPSDDDKTMASPPDDNKSMREYVCDDWFVNKATESKKLSVLSQSISVLKGDDELRTLAQKYLEIDLNEFLNSGQVIKEKGKISMARLAEYDFGWDTQLTHALDLEDLLERIEEMKKWHYVNNVRNINLAPMFSIIQSSGTGKSRLMKEACKHYLKEKKACRLILLGGDNMDDSKLIDENNYDAKFSIPSTTDKSRIVNIQQDLRRFVFDQCTNAVMAASSTTSTTTVPTVGRHSVVLFMDEAQHLAKLDGYWIRVLRWIIREKPDVREYEDIKHYDISIVMCGTNSSLADHFPEKAAEPSSSRHITVNNGYYEEGKVPFEPFFMLSTMGCLSSAIHASTSEVIGTEYDSSIAFGRPLFALMHKENKLDNKVILEIASKMLLGAQDWHLQMKSCLSILGTRVQMGHTSSSVVSDLVAKGYAHLTSFQHSSVESEPHKATFVFLPDPVCAHVAMCLMDESFKMTSGCETKQITVEGKDKPFWSQKLGEIFSSGLCMAYSGDFGEVAVALYLLFWGDIIRKENDRTLKTFSVDLFVWLGMLMPVVEKKKESIGKQPEQSEKLEPEVTLSVNFIQFFRHTLRLNIGQIGRSDFLEILFKKACGIFCPNNSEAVDLVIPCCVVIGCNKIYVPIFISVKNYTYMAPSEANKFLSCSMNALLHNGVTKGLCLLCIVGQEREKPGEYDNLLGIDDTSNLGELGLSENANVSTCVKAIHKQLVPKVMYVHNDQFGIHSALISSKARKSMHTADVYAVHSELLHESEATMRIANIKDVLPHNARKEVKDFFSRRLGAVLDKKGVSDGDEQNVHKKSRKGS